MKVRTKLATTLIGLSTLIPAKAQKAVDVIPKGPVIEAIAASAASAGGSLTKDVSARTLQFLDGTNLSALGVGLKKKYTKSSLYSAFIAGYDSGNKRPWCCGYASLDNKYADIKNNKVWLSQVLYGQFTVRNRALSSKIAYTPAKLNAQLSKRVNLTFDPRFVLQFKQKELTPKIETLTKISSSITKKLSGYVLLQTYDTLNLFKEGSGKTVCVNSGLVYTF